MTAATNAAHAHRCGRADCAHVLRSDDTTTRRASYLLGVVESGGSVPADEPAEVLAALAMLRRAPRVNGRFVSAEAEQAARDAQGYRLTRGQAEVLRMVGAEGMTQRQVAESTYRSLGTIKVHLTLAIRAMGCHSARDAAILATQHGLI
jgi:DNA-binding NarL/FixJ family response regulator